MISFSKHNEMLPIFRSRKQFSTTYAIVSFLRRRAKRGALLFASCFFRKNVTSLCICKFRLLFSRPISPRQFKILKAEPQLNALSGHVKRFRNFLASAILLASKTRFWQNFLGFFSDFA